MSDYYNIIDSAEKRARDEGRLEGELRGLEKGLEKLDADKRKRMEALLKTIDEDDNNYIFIGKLKTEFGNADEK